MFFSLVALQYNLSSSSSCLLQHSEVVRLVNQGLRDLGFVKIAEQFEAESGILLEAAEVTQFRKSAMEGDWATVILTL